jgi:hypothetical protein
MNTESDAGTSSESDSTVAPIDDNDGDGVANAIDNCPSEANPDQVDRE